VARQEENMGLKTALGLTQLTSMLVFASIASWYVAPGSLDRKELQR
jgi:hypothetical protein